MTDDLRQAWSELSHEHRGNLVEWVTEQAIVGLCIEGDSAIDIGANFGAHTHTMLVRVGTTGRVIAFEANPEITATLEKWKAQHPALEVRQVALSDHAGLADFFICDNAGFSSLDEHEIERHGRVPSKKITVPVDTLDHSVLSSLRSLRLIKIDVEGAELAVLRGASTVLSQFKPVVVIEMSAEQLRRLEPESYGIFVNSTLASGYLLMSVFGEIVEDPAPSDYQFFLVPKDDAALIEQVSRIAELACHRYFDEGLQSWTPYQKFQAT